MNDDSIIYGFSFDQEWIGLNLILRDENGYVKIMLS